MHIFSEKQQRTAVRFCNYEIFSQDVIFFVKSRHVSCPLWPGEQTLTTPQPAHQTKIYLPLWRWQNCKIRFDFKIITDNNLLFIKIDASKIKSKWKDDWKTNNRDFWFNFKTSLLGLSYKKLDVMYACRRSRRVEDETCEDSQCLILIFFV